MGIATVNSGDGGAPHYRADIDGLRAVAVLLVVAYHAKLPFVVNGFLGVDVFFVISGYVITRLLLRELGQTSGLNFAHFWRRRLVRLMPAFALMLGAVLIAAPLAMERLSGEIGPLAKAAMSAVAINANHFFFFETADYFAAATETNALLHTWSLSVEEQFYLVWPALLLLLWRSFSRVALLVAIVTLAVASFSFSIWIASSDAAAAFYLLPARAWQLLIGVALACYEPENSTYDRGHAHSQWWSIFGLVLILGAATMPRSGAPSFSAPLAAVAALGSALVIRFGVPHSSHFSARILAHPWVVYVGRISYPVYLWHWPLLVIARSRNMHEVVPAVDVACVAVSLVLGALTHEFCEKPCQRYLQNRSMSRLLWISFGTAGALACAALLLGAWTRFGWGYSPQQQALDRARHDHASVGCLYTGVGPDFPNAADMKRCFPQEGRSSVLLWGDSHAQHWAPAIKALADQNEVTFASFALGGCPPLPRREGKWRCDNFYRSVAKHLATWRDERGLRAVVLSGRWALGTGARPISAGDQAMASLSGFEEVGVKTEAEALVLFEASLRQLLADLRKLRLSVWLFLPSPNHKFGIPHCLAIRTPDQCFVSTEESATFSGRVASILRRVASEYDNVTLFDPETMLCAAGKCPAIVDGVIAYSDDDHLSATWVTNVAPRMANGFAQVLNTGVPK
jgi:peptidoglycan/LPS O-acetylase OafA/YrhL